jgi:putative peptidoglycan lipid II flippase
LGIFVTRIFGLVRTRAMTHFLGASDAADALTAATRIPNILQNLFGEGVLSASFIPVYGKLLASEHEEADRVAGAVFGILAATIAALVALGVLATPLVVDTVADGFTGAKRELTIRLVRIIFPGTGLLVLSAWCLGVLNSHRRYFLSYAAPIAWNLAIIGALIWGGAVQHARADRLVVLVAWWTVVGSALQFAVQVPTVLRSIGHFRPSLDTRSPHVREIVRNFVPVFLSRGAVQISAYVDLNFASYLGTSAQSILGYAQQIYLIPVGLFGMSISAAALAEMSREIGSDEEVRRALRSRLTSNLRHVAYFVVPSAAAFLALGDVLARVLFESGKFGPQESLRTWAVLGGSAVGLVASTLGRVYSSTFYALKDTRTPLRFALVRIAFTIALGWAFAFPLRRALGLAEVWGVAGLTASAGMAGWIEFVLLRRRLGERLGGVHVEPGFLARVWLAAALASALSWGVKLAVGTGHRFLGGVAVLGAFGVAYLGLTLALGIPEARETVGKVLRRLRPGGPRAGRGE